MRMLFAALGVLVCVGPARAQESGCAKDTDCKGARICLNRVCVEPPPVVACGRDLDCPGDDICVEKKCSKPKKKGRGAPGTPAAVAPAAAASVPPPAAAPPAEATPFAPTEPPPVLLVLPAGPPAPAPAAAAPVAAAPALPPKSPPASPVGSVGALGAPSSNTTPLAPPPLVVAPMTIRRVDEAGSSAGSPVYGIALNGGLHRWSKLDRSEGDFGLSLSGEAGLRATESLSLLGLIHGTWTLMAETAGTATSAAASNNGLLLGLGLGVRLDHLGPIPGHFTVGGLASFGTIASGAAKTAGIDVSGAAVLLQYTQPLTGWLAADAQLAWHFLSKDFALVTLSLGVSFGN